MILLTILFFSFALSINTFAQSDSLNRSSEEKNKKNMKTEDQITPSFKKTKRGKDVFIDRDGDGICDNRVEGMSFEKMRKRKHNGEGNGRHGGKK